MFFLKLRLMILIGLLFAILYAVSTMIGAFLGVTGFYFHLFLALAFMLVQYLISPMLITTMMRVRYPARSEFPELFDMVEQCARQARIPVPKVGISSLPIPNAFAFGRTVSDGRVCVTEKILQLLNAGELKAVLGHEISHLKNRDVLTITLLSVIPMVMYRLAWHMMFYGRRRDTRGSNTIIIGLAAFAFYFVTYLLVLYASRIREYFADRGSVTLGSNPRDLASALYKLAYGSARVPREEVREYEGLKAFFATDPSRAAREVRELSAIDADHNGIIDAAELEAVRSAQLKLGFADKMMELLSTHPNMLKRIRRLSAASVYR